MEVFVEKKLEESMATEDVKLPNEFLEYEFLDLAEKLVNSGKSLFNFIYFNCDFILIVILIVIYFDFDFNFDSFFFLFLETQTKIFSLGLKSWPSDFIWARNYIQQDLAVRNTFSIALSSFGDSDIHQKTAKNYVKRIFILF